MSERGKRWDYLDFEDAFCLLKWIWMDKSECHEHVMDFMALGGSGRSVQSNL